MNASLVTADSTTQIKIVAVAMVAAILVVAMGIGSYATRRQADPLLSSAPQGSQLVSPAAVRRHG